MVASNQQKPRSGRVPGKPTRMTFRNPGVLQLRNFGETFPSGIQDALWILFGAVGLLLLISRVNVSNLPVSRAAARGREIAIATSWAEASDRCCIVV